MTTRPSHAALVEEVADQVALARMSPKPVTCEDIARAILSLIFARLSDVTPEMVEAYERNYDNSIGEAENVCVSDWRAMLAASPLAAGKDSP